MTAKPTLPEIESAILSHLTHKWQTGGEIVGACRWDIPEADVLQVATVLLNISILQGKVEHKSEGETVYYRLPQSAQADSVEENHE